MAKLLVKWVQMVLVAGGLMLAMGSWADDEGSAVQTKRPGYGAVVADAVLVRPVTLLATIGGAAVWVVTIPITALTGTIGEAGYTLVAEPAAATFLRCLGCTEVGWRKFPKKETGDDE